MGKDKYYIIDMQQYIFFEKKLIKKFALKIFFSIDCNNLIMKMKF